MKSTFFKFKVLCIGDLLIIDIYGLKQSYFIFYTCGEVPVLLHLILLISPSEEASKKILGQNYATSTFILPMVFILKHYVASALVIKDIYQ